MDIEPKSATVVTDSRGQWRGNDVRETFIFMKLPCLLLKDESYGHLAGTKCSLGNYMPRDNADFKTGGQSYVTSASNAFIQSLSSGP